MEHRPPTLTRGLALGATLALIVACDPCKTSCQEEGRCERSGTKCVATDEGCKKSHACQSGGKCNFDPTTKTCVAGGTAAGAGADSCASAPGCAADGACGSVMVTAGKVEEFGKGGVDVKKAVYACGPTKLEHCKQSAVCKRLGHCSLKDKSCAAVTDADCRSSEECSRRGRCNAALDSTVCYAATDADCAASAECTSHGHCVALKGVAYNRTETCGPKSADVCKKTPACKSDGHCTAVPTGRGFSLCLPGGDADCKSSEACKTQGRCRRVDRTCEK